MTNIVNNIILLESLYTYLIDDLRETLTDNTDIIIYERDIDTFEDIKQIIHNYIDDNNSVITNIALFNENDDQDVFNCFSDESSIVLDVSTQDFELNTWTKFNNFVQYLQNDLNIENFDLLMCRIYSDENWKFVLDKIESSLINLNIRSSDDNTGHVLGNGDWILESETIDVDLVNTYFNEKIYDIEIILGNQFGLTISAMDTSGNIYYAGSNHNKMYGPGPNFSNSCFRQIVLPTLNENEKVRVYSCGQKGGSATIIVTTENRIFAVGKDGNYRRLTKDYPLSTANNVWIELYNSFLYSDENIIQVNLYFIGGGGGTTNVLNSMLLTDYGRVFYAGQLDSTSYNIKIKNTTYTVAQEEWGEMDFPKPIIKMYNDALMMFRTNEDDYYVIDNSTSGYSIFNGPTGETINEISCRTNHQTIITVSNELYTKGSGIKYGSHGVTGTSNVGQWTNIPYSLLFINDSDEYAIDVDLTGAQTHVITNKYNYYNVGDIMSGTLMNPRGTGNITRTNDINNTWSKISTAIDGTNIEGEIAKAYGTQKQTFIITKDGGMLATGKWELSGFIGVGLINNSLNDSQNHRHTFDWCRLSNSSDIRLENICQLPGETEFIDAITPAPTRLVTFDSSGIKYDVTDYINGDKTTITTYTSGHAVKVETYNDPSNNPVIRTTEPYPNGDIETLTTYSSIHTKRVTEYATGITITIVINVDSNNNPTTETTTVDASNNTTFVYDYIDSNSFTVKETTYSSGASEKYIIYYPGYTRREAIDVSGGLTLTIVTTNILTDVVTTTITDPNDDVTVIVESTDSSGNSIVETTYPSGEVITVTTYLSGDVLTVTEAVSGITTSILIETDGTKTTTTEQANGDTTIVVEGTDSNGDSYVRTTDVDGIIETVTTYSVGNTKTVTVQVNGDTRTVIISTDSNGHVTTTTTEPNGDTTIIANSEDSNGNAVLTTTYPSGTVVVKTTYSVGNSNTTSTDSGGNVTTINEVTNGAGVKTTTTTAPNGDITTAVQTLDASNNIVVVTTYPTGIITTSTTDAITGDVSIITELPSGDTTTTEQTTDSSGNTVSTTTDASGTVTTATTTPGGETTTVVESTDAREIIL